MLFYKICKYLLFITILLHKITTQGTQIITFRNNPNCKFIQIKNSIIFILNDSNDINIYDYNQQSIKSYSSDISLFKDILKINEEKYVIIGLDGNYNFVYEIFDNQGSDKKEPKLKIDNGSLLKQFEGRMISENILLLFGCLINSNNFLVHKLYLDSGVVESYSFQANSRTTSKNIQCDGLNEKNFICLTSFIIDGDNSNWKMQYYQFGESYTSIGNICERNCKLGNILKLSDKYLVCYHYGDLVISIKCQYFSYENDELKISKTYEVVQIESSKNSDNPLLFKIFDSSIFLLTDLYFRSFNIGIMIESSIDFVINIKYLFSSGQLDCKSNNIFKDSDKLFLFYEESTNTIVREITYSQCKTDYIIITDSDKNVIFDNGITNQKIVFSLDENIKLYKGNELIGMTSNNFITLNNENFVFKKLENAGVYYNYYAYALASSSSSEYFSSFSLICPLRVIKCPESCSNCENSVNVSPTNHLCTQCASNYFKKEEDIGKASFNCYKQGEIGIENYYFDTDCFKLCDGSCKSCISATECTECVKDKYFIDNNINDNLCYSFDSTNPYYLDYKDNKLIYKECYKTCATCSAGGDETHNNCHSCKSGSRQYVFNEQQCTENTTYCFEQKKYWVFSNNNVKCVDTCDKYVVFTGNNMGQCVDDCENFINPYSITSSNSLFKLECDAQKFCIPLRDICENGYYRIDYRDKTCERFGDCFVDFFGGKNNLYDPPTQDTSTDEISIDEKKEEIRKRQKIVKVLTKKNSFSIGVNYEPPLITQYIQLLKNEEKEYINQKIYLISSIQYDNFTITIYPLDIEDYVYERIFFPNNLGYINFTDFFDSFLEYEIKERKTILVGVLEFQASNTAIKDLNYFLYSFDESNEDTYNNGNVFNLNDLKNSMDKQQIEILYPLFNYKNSNSKINKRNTESLVDNINYMSEKYPQIELSNLSDPFYTDICFLFTTDVGTDMTLNDRRSEYYVNISLCEKNCVLLKVIDKNVTPRAVCSCDVKTNIFFGNQYGLADENSTYSVQNSKSIKCISQSFNHNISKNGIFWVFIIIIILQVYLFIIYIKYQDNIINGVLKINKNVTTEIDDNDSMRSSSEDKFSYINKKNDLENNVSDEYEQPMDDKKSAPTPTNAPPKKKLIDYRRPNSSMTKTDIKEEKDLISGSGSSIIKESTNKLNDKNQDFNTDMSFDDIQNEFFRIDPKKEIIKDNYLKDPLFEERRKLLRKIEKSFKIKESKRKKYLETCEDILNPNKKTFKRNRKIIKMLGGQNLLHQYMIENNSENEKNPRFLKSAIKKDLSFDEEKGIFSDDIIFSNNFLRANKKKNADEDDSINKLLKAKKTNNSLAKSLGKGQIKKIKEEEKNSDIRLKTETDDGNNKIKKELEKIGKGEIRPRSNMGRYRKNIKNIKSSIQDEQLNNNNNLIKVNTVQPLKLIDNKENNKDLSSKGIDSKRVMVNFQEEEICGDRGQPKLEEEDILRIKRSKNLELLNEQNFLTSITEELTVDKQQIFLEENFILYFWKYFMKRELFITCIKDKKKTIPYFIRYSCLGFSFSFIFLLNCFLFLESDVHKRYINALAGKRNRMGYYFKKEFGTTVCVSLLADLFKILVIKLVLVKLFKIGKKAKKLMRPSSEIGLNKIEMEKLLVKRAKFMNDYKRNLMIYYIILMCLNCFIAYICICYGGVFHNSIGAFFYGLVFSLIFSFIFCAVFCLGIVSLYRLGKYLDSRCVKSAYVVLSTLY